MKKFLAYLALCLPLIGCAGPDALRADPAREIYSPPDGSIILRVEVLDAEFTNFHPGCGEESGCIPFYFWYSYRARVKDVVSGTWASPEVSFVHLQHGAYIQRFTRDCYVVLTPAGQELRSALGVSLVADKILSRSFKPDKAAIKDLLGGA